MAVDAFMIFIPYKGAAVASESQVDFSKTTANNDPIGKPFLGQAGNVFEVSSFGFGIDQTINMSSQASGSGAGKVNFESFSVSRLIDKASPLFFQMACQGTAFKQVSLGIRKAGGADASGLFFLRFDFKFVAIKSMKWSHGDDSPTEDMEFDYGGLQMTYGIQGAGGAITPQNMVGWNKIKNILDVTDAPIGS